MLRGFKEFVLRGNVLDLAVAVVIGGAFGAVIAALVKDLLTPLIGALVTQPDFSSFTVTLNGSTFLVGDFLNAAISFLLIAGAVYFAVVVPMNAIVARSRRGEGDTGSDDEEVRGVFERCADRGQAVCVLHVAADLEW